MKHDDSRAGLSRYDLIRNADGMDVPTYPAESGKVHAVIDHPRNPYSRIPYRSITDTTDTDFDWEYTAECGATVRVLLTIAFDDTEPDACRQCTELMVARSVSDDEYKRAVSKMHERRRLAWQREQEKDQEREDITAWRRKQNRDIVRRAFPHLDDVDPEV